jgi:hypothetical protein
MSTCIKIQTVTVGAGGAASIDFTSIPATYTDLKLVASLRSTRAGNVKDTIDLKINNVTTTLSQKYLQGNGTSASSGSLSNYWGETDAATATASVFGNMEFYFPNYASANYKSFSIDTVSEDNATLAIAELIAGLWSNTTAINQLTLLPVTGPNWAQYSSATLYGIKAS